jgi:hypothetical protein
MLRKLYLVPVLAMFLVPAIAQAQFEEGDWSLELAGSGGNDKDFDGGSLGLNFELGYFLTKELELGARQGLTWADAEGGDSIWNGSTFVFLDYHFDMDRWQPYIGANIGYQYGDLTDDNWSAGPEGGVKYFVNTTTYIDLQASYQFDLEEGFDEGAFLYSLAIGFKW